MPPTRGHDLKLFPDFFYLGALYDAPHTGARLETLSRISSFLGYFDAPHTGARLETSASLAYVYINVDAPHTGARLETKLVHCANVIAKMPPTRGHDLKL